MSSPFASSTAPSLPRSREDQLAFVLNAIALSRPTFIHVVLHLRSQYPLDPARPASTNPTPTKTGPLDRRSTLLPPPAIITPSSSPFRFSPPTLAKLLPGKSAGKRKRSISHFEGISVACINNDTFARSTWVERRNRTIISRRRIMDLEFEISNLSVSNTSTPTLSPTRLHSSVSAHLPTLAKGPIADPMRQSAEVESDLDSESDDDDDDDDDDVIIFI
ncbi:hypothetical protein P7C73_g1001, partial [Tremellales sp. Uapishka_1]